MLPGPRPLQAVVWLHQPQDGVHPVGVLGSEGGGGRGALHLLHPFTGLLATSSFVPGPGWWHQVA